MQHDRIIYGALTYAMLFAAGLYYELPAVTLCALTSAMFAGLVGALVEAFPGVPDEPLAVSVILTALALLTYILPTFAAAMLLVHLLV